MQLNRALVVPLLVLVAGPVAAPAGAAPAYAVDTINSTRPCDGIEDPGESRYLTDATSTALEAMGIEAAHDLFRGGGLPGAGVRVAVVDSGVDATSGLIDVVKGPSFANRPELMDYHGTAVAGLVAARPRGEKLTGVAPGAQIVDVRVYDDDEPDEGAVGIETERVVEGLEWVADNARKERIGVVVVALRVSPTPQLAAVVRRLHREEDVVVVAASGNRPREDTDPLTTQYGELRPGEDAADVIYPAGYTRDVLAVSATVGGYPDEAETDPRTFVLQSSAIDVAAPTYEAVSLGMNGSTCRLYDPATSWAAAEVAGVVALLRARFRGESADQVVARLRQTATGSPEDHNVLTGAGVVQPVEALTRRLTPDRRGDLDLTEPADSDIPRAVAPVPETDALADAKHEAVWWGLAGGGAVVLALLLRPLLARRRGAR